jgi:PAT family beta-lactamase induction signal transducer AmpG
MATDRSLYLQVFLNRRVGVMVLLGFSSGLPLALTGGTLQAWMAVAGVDLFTIGLFALVGLPYTVKFIWSPLMDRYVPPWLGRRRGWALPLQAALAAAIAALAFTSPEISAVHVAVLALAVAFMSASQDIALDAYRTDVLREVERGAGAAVFVTGYRMGMLFSGALALVLSDQIGWRSTYLLMAGLMIVGIAGTLLGPEPDMAGSPPRSLREAVLGPLEDFLSRRGALSFILLMILYKLGDAYAGTLTTAFLIRGVGFSATDVGAINKGMGLVAVVLGATLGGTLMVRLGLFRALLFFGVLQMVSNLSFMALAWAGKSYPVMIFAIAFENVTGGMGTSAFVSLLMALCNRRFSATQFALLSSLAALGRVLIAPTSGYVVQSIGWPAFFLLTTLCALPGLLMLWKLRDRIAELKRDEGHEGQPTIQR